MTAQYLRCVEPLDDPGVDHLLQVGQISVAGGGLKDRLQQRPWAPGVLEAIVVNDFGQGDLKNFRLDSGAELAPNDILQKLS